ncbi:MAG: hypothetical protein JST28_06410 [Acidobacteria bacterium]|nr:hypothetical protein [Acidobacteriota bacterium]
MATSAHGVWNQGSSLSAGLKPMSASSSGADSTSNGNSASIAANDFLTLLVTEMKNQDPTATTDPNEYVNQLVQVNSLQQLISINETLQKATATDAGSDTTPVASSAEHVPALTAGAKSAGPTGAVGSAEPSGKRYAPSLEAASARVATALTGK